MANTRGKDGPKDDGEQTQEPETVRLRYLGPSHTFVDNPTGQTFVKDGPARGVTVEDAQRLLHQPHESFDRE